MNAALELIRIVESSGGRFMVDGDRLGIVPATAAAPVMEELRRHKMELLAELVQRTTIPPQDPEEWQGQCSQWLTTVCVRRPRDFAGLVCLYRSFAEWQNEHNDWAPPIEVFEALLKEQDFLTGEIAGTKLVSGLAFRDDVEPVARF